MLDASPFNAKAKPRETLCLGLVCIAEHQQLSVAMARLQSHGTPTLGEPQGNRIPACVFTQRGQDKELIAELEALEGVAKIEVAYAHTIEEDEVQ